MKNELVLNSISEAGILFCCTSGAWQSGFKRIPPLSFFFLHLFDDYNDSKESTGRQKAVFDIQQSSALFTKTVFDLHRDAFGDDFF